MNATATAVLLLACAIALLSAPRASAMFDGPAYAFPVPDYVSGLIGQSALSNAYGASDSSSGSSKKGSSKRKPKAKPKPRKPTAAQRRALRFTETPAVTQRINQLVIERTGADPAVLLPVLDKVRADWRQVLTKNVKWSPRDLGDATAFTFIQLNNQYRGQGQLDERAVASIRTLVRDDLARKASVRRLSAARKQEAVEVLQLRTIFLATTRDLRQQAGDAAGVRAAKEDIRSFTRETFGIDLQKVKVGKKGLVATKKK
ncbi:MAG: DUF6683 family protein [Patulibacter sp.]